MNSNKVFLLLTLILISLSTAKAQKPRIENAELYFLNSTVLIDNTNFVNGQNDTIWCSGHERSVIAGVVHYKMELKYTVKSDGIEGDFRTSVSIDNFDIPVASEFVTSMGVGEVRNFTTSVWLPVGVHTVRIFTDDMMQVAESNEDNNKLFFHYMMGDLCSESATAPNMQQNPINNNGNNANDNKDPKNPNLNLNNSNNFRSNTQDKGKMDIYAEGGGLMINGRFVKWGGTLKLSCKDALPGGGANNRYGFNINYKMKNYGNKTTDIFLNKLYSGAGGIDERSINSNLKLGPNEVKEVLTQVYLDCGTTNMLTIILDKANNVSETNEKNNKYYILYSLDCNECK